MPRKVLLNLSGPLGGIARCESLERRWCALGKSWRDLAEHWRVPAGDHATVLAPETAEWAHRKCTDAGLLRELGIEVLGGHDSAVSDSRRLQGKLGEIIYTAVFRQFTSELNALPEGRRQPQPDDSHGGVE